METSDSECFESADEDFQSDDEDTTTVKSVTETPENQTNKCVKPEKVGAAKVTAEAPESNLSNNNTNPPDTCKTEIVKVDDENNISTSTDCKDKSRVDEKIDVHRGLEDFDTNGAKQQIAEPCGATKKQVQVVDKPETLCDLSEMVWNTEKFEEKKLSLDPKDVPKQPRNVRTEETLKELAESIWGPQKVEEKKETDEPKDLPNVHKQETVQDLAESVWGKKKVEESWGIRKVQEKKQTVESKDVHKQPKNVDKTDTLWDQSELDWGTEKIEEKKKTVEPKDMQKQPKNVCKQETQQDLSESILDTEKVEEKKRTVEPKDGHKQPKNVDKTDTFWDQSELDWGREQEEDNMWTNDDDWEPVESPQPQTKASASLPPSQVKPSIGNTGWGSWGTWDMSSLISTATQGVSTFTHGITTVLESGIGVPEPEELARINRSKQAQEFTPEEGADKNTGFGLGNLVMGVSHLTKLVETTGTKVISGGLDTLETIGKKTMEVLQEGDPGLKKKRAFLLIDQNKPVLSQLLREAKEKAEQENKDLEQKHFTKKAKNYETLFDDHQGLVHLEALEMLSKQCDIKLQTLLESYTGDALTEMQETMEQVKELCELPDEDEDEHANWTEIKDNLNSAVTEINIPITYKRLVETWEETETWLNNLKLEVCDERELHQQAIDTLAQLTAIAVEQFHKAGELLLVKEHRSTADEADSLVQLTTTLTSQIGVVAAKFSDKLNAKSSSSKNKEQVNGLITNVFFEAANSSSYIQDAFQLLIPVLQVGAV